jgi:hypothetical protein
VPVAGLPNYSFETLVLLISHLYFPTEGQIERKVYK